MSEKIVCGNCGASNAADAIVCGQCGAVLAAYAPISSAPLTYDTATTTAPTPETIESASSAMPDPDIPVASTPDPLAPGPLPEPAPITPESLPESRPVAPEPEPVPAPESIPEPEPLPEIESLAEPEPSFPVAMPPAEIVQSSPIQARRLPAKPVEERTYPTFKQAAAIRERFQRGNQIPQGTFFQRLNAFPPIAFVFWSVLALIFGCVLMGIGTSFDGGGCIVGIGFLIVAFSLIGLFYGAGRFRRK
jgi:hypothetical protein